MRRCAGTAPLADFGADGGSEARKYSCSDEGFVDLLLKTSDDGGRSWSRSTLVHTDSTATDWCVTFRFRTSLLQRDLHALVGCGACGPLRAHLQVLNCQLQGLRTN